MSLDKLKFILENNNDEKNHWFDNFEQAFNYITEDKPIYLFIWENGKFLEQYKVELRTPNLTPELLNRVKQMILNRFGRKAVLYVNYPSHSLSRMGRLIIKDMNYIKFTDY